MLDLGSPSLAEALLERDLGYALARRSGDCGPAANFQGNPEKAPIRRSAFRQEIQLTFAAFARMPNAVKPERRAWAKPPAPVVPKKVRKKRRETRKPTDHAASYSEIGRALGVSYQRVRQIEARALEKCREACERLGITPDVFLGAWRDSE